MKFFEKYLKLIDKILSHLHIIAVLSDIMPDTYAKCYYLKKLYERGGSNDR